MEKNGAVTDQTPTSQAGTQKQSSAGCCGDCNCSPQFPRNDEEAKTYIGNDVVGDLSQAVVSQKRQ